MYETRRDVRGQAYLAAIRPPLRAAGSNNAFALGLDAHYAMGSYMQSVAMAAPGSTMSGGFSDPRVRTAFERQANEIVTPQRSATAGKQTNFLHMVDSSARIAQTIGHGVGPADQGCSGGATHHQAFLSPQAVREEIHNRVREAAARGVIGESGSLRSVAEESSHQDVVPERGGTLLMGIKIETEGAQGHADKTHIQGAG